MKTKIRNRYGKGLIVLLALLGSSGAANSGPTDDLAGRAGSSRAQMIGPGKVQLTFTRTGKWESLTTEWTKQQNLISQGGFVVTAMGVDGEIRQIANTADGSLLSGARIHGASRFHEGMRGGFRAPSPAPDDDGDGRVDEDRLDGIDNDRDGLIDEDFAAVGDEMIVTEFMTPPDQRQKLRFHQEAYAWALPNIDGLIMMRLAIKNTGDEAIEDIRVAAFFERRGPLTVVEQSVQLDNTMGPGQPRAQSIATSESNGNALAAIFFGFESLGGWKTGVSAEAETVGGTRGRSAKKKSVAAGETAFVYGVTPSLGTLEPNREIIVHAALVVEPFGKDIEKAARAALETFVGDGKHRYLPPPVSLTPEVLWGKYRTVSVGEDGFVIDVIGVGGVSSFTGVRSGSVEALEDEPGVLRVTLEQTGARDFPQRGDRLVLKGRLETGEFFEAILAPEDRGVEARPFSTKDAERFWRTPGKLSEDLLSGSPNPFRDATMIYYEVPSRIEQADGSQLRSNGPLETSVKVYNVVGRLVSVLADEPLTPGVHTTQWNAVDDTGNLVASGVYYVKLQIEKRFITKRLILLK